MRLEILGVSHDDHALAQHLTCFALSLCYIYHLLPHLVVAQCQQEVI